MCCGTVSGGRGSLAGMGEGKKISAVRPFEKRRHLDFKEFTTQKSLVSATFFSGAEACPRRKLFSFAHARRRPAFASGSPTDSTGKTGKL